MMAERVPKGDLADAINGSFGSFDAFKEQFNKAAATLFGAGWAWLVKKEDGTLQIVQESNAGNPLRKGLKPLITCDVWEHAYYIDYRNKRPDYIKSFWEILDWDLIAKGTDIISIILNGNHYNDSLFISLYN